MFLIFFVFGITYIFYLVKKNNKKLIPVILTILIIFSSILFLRGVNDTKGWEKTFCFVPSKVSFDNFIATANWIKNHTEPQDKIGISCGNELRYYVRRKTKWISPYESPHFYEGIIEHNKRQVIESMKEENIKFIVIPLNLVTKRRPNTPAYIKKADYHFINSNFNKVFSVPGFEVFSYENIIH